mgnify:CR=1 FL=1
MDSMRPSPDEIREALAAIAHGEPHPWANWVAAQPEYAGEVASWRGMGNALNARTYSAGADAIAAAKALFPERRVAPLFGALGFAGARRDGGAQMAQVEVGTVRIRVLYSPTASGWSVMGEGEGEFEVEARGGSAMVEAGRFSFEVSQLADAEFEVSTSEGVWTVEAPEAS